MATQAQAAQSENSGNGSRCGHSLEPKILVADMEGTNYSVQQFPPRSDERRERERESLTHWRGPTYGEIDMC